MRAGVNRRDVARWVLSAPIGGLLTSKFKAHSLGLHQGSMAVENAVRTKIAQAIDAGSAMGVAVAIIESGRLTVEEGFGWANREAGIRATPHTPFSMASITKPFSTATLMTLVQQGRVNLDRPANSVLGSSRIFGSNGDPNAVTVRMLGAHVSGLPGMYESYDDAESRLVPSLDTLLNKYGRLAYQPGAVYEYSNIGYAALNAIASSLTDKEFGALMHERVLAPLGLEDSFFSSDKTRVPSGATRYDPLGHAIPHYVTSTAASGELFASAHDLAQFVLFNMGRRVPHQRRPLDTRSLLEVHRPVFRGPSGVASTFGWFQGRTPSGVLFFFKSGGDPGVANRICFVPSKGLACVVVTNQSNSAPLAYGICDEVMRSQIPDWQQPEEYCGHHQTLLVDPGPFAGEWHGTLQNDGLRLPVRLELNSAEQATFSMGNSNSKTVNKIYAEGEALTGVVNCAIDSPDALRAGADTLQIKLMPQAERLIGRLFANAGDPNFRSARLPYVLSLQRSADARK